jgi:hypothetical protein
VRQPYAGVDLIPLSWIYEFGTANIYSVYIYTIVHGTVPIVRCGQKRISVLRIRKYFFWIWVRPDADLDHHNTSFWALKNMFSNLDVSVPHSLPYIIAEQVPAQESLSI